MSHLAHKIENARNKKKTPLVKQPQYRMHNNYRPQSNQLFLFPAEHLLQAPVQRPRGRLLLHPHRLHLRYRLHHPRQAQGQEQQDRVHVQHYRL